MNTTIKRLAKVRPCRLCELEASDGIVLQTRADRPRLRSNRIERRRSRAVCAACVKLIAEAAKGAAA